MTSRYSGRTFDSESKGAVFGSRRWQWKRKHIKNVDEKMEASVVSRR
jgi:hypothetical protein